MSLSVVIPIRFDAISFVELTRTSRAGFQCSGASLVLSSKSFSDRTVFECLTGAIGKDHRNMPIPTVFEVGVQRADQHPENANVYSHT
jgi:hypothetical protein